MKLNFSEVYHFKENEPWEFLNKKFSFHRRTSSVDGGKVGSPAKLQYQNFVKNFSLDKFGTLHTHTHFPGGKTSGKL